MKDIYWISGGAVVRENDDSLSAVCGYPQAPDAAETLSAQLEEPIARWLYVNGWDGVNLELGIEPDEDYED